MPILFADFNFEILGRSDFKEDSVREDLIAPLVAALGYKSSGKNVVKRSAQLTHPFVKVGTRNRPILNFPDYSFTVDGKTSWILDAKAPSEKIVSGVHRDQAYFYAIHPDVRVNLYGLCNGRELAIFHISEEKPVLYIHLSEINKHWDSVRDLLSPTAFSAAARSAVRRSLQRPSFDYLSIVPPKEITDFHKQGARRHFGVHGYFTKQIWSVVQAYIKNFTQPGDLVLDPFGGTGVTLIESLVLGRRGIHIDINPLSIFIVKTLITPVDLNGLVQAFEKIRTAYKADAPSNEAEAVSALKKYSYPKNKALPKTSDVPTVDKLFSPLQLAQLAFLRHLINKTKDEAIRDHLRLMFSGLVNKVNLTYHASEGRSEYRGDSSVFRYYRYRIAPQPPAVDVMRVFESRLKRVLASKQDLNQFLTDGDVHDSKVYKGTATDLSGIKNESIDYIYTDPPYGSKIPYLDLSTMWNAWLDLPVTLTDLQYEAIEGGELEKTKADYSGLLALSIQEMYRVLKFDRWMSFVFAHKDPAYWHLIVDTAEKAGFEYAGAVKQSNGQTTFKKRQNPFTVLAGQLIINFRKVRNPRAIMTVSLGADIADVVMETIESVIAQHGGAELEQINDELVLKGLELGFLDILSREYQDLTPLLTSNFDYDAGTKKYQIKKNRKFKSRIDIRLRIRYFLVSYMRRLRHERRNPTFDEIILAIMPLLKNGITPENQTILSVLEDVATKAGADRWQLKEGGPQADLF